MFDLNSSPLARRSFLGASVGAMAAGFAAQALPALAQTPTDVPSNFFPGFRRHTIQTSGTTINVVIGGNGSPILLLHGYPQTHVEWRKIAPQLSANYTVVIPDLRGYGDSGKPEDGDNHINYSKRAMAAASIDLVHDEADMDKKIACPVLVLWGAKGLVGRKYDVLAIWRERATQVSGKGLASSHWLAEEVPDETLAEVKPFLAA